MPYLAQVAPNTSSGQVTVTYTVGGQAPPSTLPAVATPPPKQPLPLTGAPVIAGIDLALLLTVAGAVLVTIANRRALRPTTLQNGPRRR